MANIVKTTVFLADMSLFADMNKYMPLILTVLSRHVRLWQ